MQKLLAITLMETLVVLTIIGILSICSMPLYIKHIAQERRLEAALELNKLALAMEQYYTFHNTYKGVTLETLGFHDKIADNRYQLSINTVTDNNFKLYAEPLGAQAKQDTDCATLTLNSVGEKGMTGSGQLMNCW